MGDYSREIEAERVMNVIRGFGWEKIREEMINDELVLTIKKKILVAPPREEVET